MKKKLSIMLAAIAACGSMFALTACGKHEHSFDGKKWQTDATSHWHVCAGKDCKEISDKADHVYSHACDATCNVCEKMREISYYAIGEDPIDRLAGWVGLENINGVAGGQYVFKIVGFDSQYQLFLTSDRMDWSDGNKAILRSKYILRMFDEDFNELIFEESNAEKYFDCYFLDENGKDTEEYEGKTLYMMIELKEAMTFCPVAN